MDSGSMPLTPAPPTGEGADKLKFLDNLRYLFFSK